MINRCSILLTVVVCVFAASCAQASAPKDLLSEGKVQYSLDGGNTFSATPPTLGAKSYPRVLMTAEFSVTDLADVLVLELTHGLPPDSRFRTQLNGEPLPLPLPGMRYKMIPAIDVKLLKKGANTLVIKTSIRGASREKYTSEGMRLLALKAEHLKIQTGPILGAFGEDYFTVTCRTNMPAKVSLPGAPGAKSLPSKLPGIIHRIRAPLAQQKEQMLKIDVNGEGFREAIRLPDAPSADKLRFIAVGDSRTHPDRWMKVAASVAKAKPDLIVFSGDMVNDGRNDWQWDDEFFGPAGELFTTVPIYAVIGNHEQDAPVYDELFCTPTEDGRGRNWAQRVGPALLVGIDGRQDWSADGENARWLDRTLAAAGDAKFIFLTTHYPAWSSSSHGKARADGLPAEATMRASRSVVGPLLAKYNATAMLAGHDHCYERSAPPDGVVYITTGGAGAPSYKQAEDAAKRNPHSKVFASELHYCLFVVDGDVCELTVITPEGKTLDTYTFSARTPE